MFYIAGFDPRGVQFHHRRYADIAALQTEVHTRAHAAGPDDARALQAFTVGRLEADRPF